MDRNYKRIDFIRLSAMAAAGLYLTACGVKSDDKKAVASKTDTLPAPKPEVKKPQVPITLIKKGDPQYDTLEPDSISASTNIPLQLHYARQRKKSPQLSHT